MRKLAFLLVAFALVAVSFYGCDENSPLEPPEESRDQTATFARFPPSSAEALYQVLQLHDFRIDPRVHDDGVEMQVAWALRNKSQSSLPLITYENPRSGFTCSAVGIFQFWLERVGPDKEIPALSEKCCPRIARDDRGRYAAGGYVVCQEAPWGGKEERRFARGQVFSGIPTTDPSILPLGHYRLYLDYKKLFQDGGDVLSTSRASFRVR